MSSDASTPRDGASETESESSSTDAPVVLDVDGLEAGYETGQVLFGVDLSIHEGELVSLLGRNGAGKTTTIRAIMGGDVPTVTQGDVRYRGESILGLESYQRANRGIAIVPEKRRCFPRLSVVENIQLAVNTVEDSLSVDAVLEFFPELDDMRQKHARNMSGGEQQMLAIARALAANPDLMLLDEPFEGLAPYIVRRIEDIIADINDEKGVTVFFVEQNVAAALAIGSRHYILDEGQVVAEVSTERLRKDDALRQTYLGV
ncbi:ABC transporter ATP-binding protein [Haloarchaeobius sp. DT45]|uniref:ABC transporter ATP-binding protein n=1 Tax=Haloarchaeobius sp. DT45 TaxID=3446116 RepID=UPI003F6BE316